MEIGTCGSRPTFPSLSASSSVLINLFAVFFIVFAVYVSVGECDLEDAEAEAKNPTRISSVRTTGVASCVSEFGIPCLLGQRPSQLMLTIDQPYHKRMNVALTLEKPPSVMATSYAAVPPPMSVVTTTTVAPPPPPLWQGHFCNRSMMVDSKIVEADDVGVRATVVLPVLVNGNGTPTQDYYFCLLIGREWIHQGHVRVRVKSLVIHGDNLRAGVISGFRAEGDRTTIDDDGTVAVPAETDVVLRLYGFNFTEGTSIRFTSARGDRLERCDDFGTTKAFVVSPEGLTDRHAMVRVQLSELGVDEYYYICTKEVRDNGRMVTWTHQGSDTWMRLRPEGRILPLWLQMLFIVILLTLSGLFSGLNLGLMALDRTELKIIENTGSESEKLYARRISPVRKLGNYLLCTLLLGNVLVNSSLTILLDNLTSGLVAIIGSTLAIVLFGEIIPQAICSRHGLAVGAHTVWVTKFFMIVTFPLSFPISKLLDVFLGEEIGNVYNRERLKELIRVTNEYHDLQKDEVNIISGALELSKKTVNDVMTKLDDVFTVPYDALLDFDMVSIIMKQGYSRVPVHEGTDKSNIVALLNIKDLAFVDPDDNTPLKTLVQFYNHPINYVFEDTTLAAMLDEFKKGQSHMAFVQHVNTETEGDPFYEVVGVVTLEDVIEEIIQSEIIDETDIVTDNRRKLRRTVVNMKQDFSVFAQQGENQRVQISPQMTLATFQYLSTALELFQPTHISESVLRRLMKQDIYYQLKMKTKEALASAQAFIFQIGKPTDYFVLILEGRVQVTIGKENLIFECGPFTYFGIQALAQTSPQVDGSPLPTSASVPNNIPSAGMQIALSGGTLSRTSDASTKTPPPVVMFVPDYTVQAVSDLLYMCIKRTHYLAALRATLMEQQHRLDPNEDPFKNVRSDSMEKLAEANRRMGPDSARNSGRSNSSFGGVAGGGPHQAYLSNQSLQSPATQHNNESMGDYGNGGWGVGGGGGGGFNANGLSGRKLSVADQQDHVRSPLQPPTAVTPYEIPEDEALSLRASHSDLTQVQNGQIPTQPNLHATIL